LIEQVGPALHHLDALRPVLGAVVGGSDLVLLDVGELAIDDAQVDTKLLLDVGHGQGAEAVAAHAPIETHALEGHVHGVVADEASSGALALEGMAAGAAGAADGLLGLEERCGLAGEGHEVLTAVASAPMLLARMAASSSGSSFQAMQG
jgi:hypothetical protein